MSWDERQRGRSTRAADARTQNNLEPTAGSQLEESKQRSLQLEKCLGHEQEQVSPSGFPPNGHSRPGTRLALTITHHDHDCAAKLPR